MLHVMGWNLKLEWRQVSSREPLKREIQCMKKAEAFISEQVNRLDTEVSI